MRSLCILRFATVGALLACQSSTALAPQLSVAVSVDPSPAIAGSPLSIAVAVSNHSDAERYVGGSMGGCFAIVEVRDARGDLVSNATPRICDAGSRRHAIAPSATIVDRLSFTGLTAGTYLVRARVGVVDHEELQSQYYTVTVHNP
jgi:hypothetical protein